MADYEMGQQAVPRDGLQPRENGPASGALCPARLRPADQARDVGL